MVSQSKNRFKKPSLVSQSSYVKVADAENLTLQCEDECNFEHVKNHLILEHYQKLKIFEARSLFTIKKSFL